MGVIVAHVATTHVLGAGWYDCRRMRLQLLVSRQHHVRTHWERAVNMLGYDCQKEWRPA